MGGFMPKLQYPHILKIILFVCSICYVQTVLAGEKYDEKVVFDFDEREWRADRAEITKSGNKVKYTLPDESVDDWSELVTTTFYFNKNNRDNMSRIKNRYKGFMKLLCPNFYWNDVYEDDDLVIATYYLDGCTLGKDNYYSIVVFYKGDDGIHQVSYATHDQDVFEERQDQWQSSFENLSLFSPDESRKNFNKKFLNNVNRMIKIQYHFDSPQVTRNKFEFTPRTLYRSSTKYFRHEEQEDTKNETHNLFIVNEPDVWIVNLYDNSGQHEVDDGPTFHTRVPVFGDKKNNATIDFEFGQEQAYFKYYGARQVSDTTINSEYCQAYELTRGNWVLHLYVSDYSQLPYVVTRKDINKRVQLVWYDSYETDLILDASLFQKPENVKF